MKHILPGIGQDTRPVVTQYIALTGTPLANVVAGAGAGTGALPTTLA